MNKSKQKNKDLIQKLKGYSLAAGAVLAVGNSTNAQVQYSGPIEENFTAGQAKVIDLDGDGNNDFVIYQSNTSVRMNNYGNSFIADLGVWYHAALSSSFAIAPGSSYPFYWNTNSWGLGWSGATYNTPWANADHKFLGVRFDIGGNTHYGWIRLSMPTAFNEFTVHDWAYEQTPDTPILAGDMGSGGGGAPAVPIAPWAAAGAGGLIGLFLLFRSRRNKIT